MSARGSAQADRLRLKDIRDGVIVLRGGQFRAVMEVGSVNLLLLDDTDQRGLIASFAAALNSWSFPVQVLIRVLPVDLDRYLTAMERRAAQLSSRLAELARDHRLYVRRLARNDALLDHRSYVVVPADEPHQRWRWFRRRPKEQPQVLTDGVRQQLNLRAGRSSAAYRAATCRPAGWIRRSWPSCTTPSCVPSCRRCSACGATSPTTARSWSPRRSRKGRLRNGPAEISAPGIDR